MKKFRVQIFAYQLRTDFIIESLDGPIDIENAIIDKLGKNDIKWEHLGEMHDPRVNSCLLYTSPSPRDTDKSRMPSSA